MSVTVVLEIPVKEGIGAEVVDGAFLGDLLATVAFPGNEHTEVLSDSARPDHLYLVTRWDSDESYDRYSAWRGSPEGATHLSEIASGAPTIHRFHTRLAF